jgi:hypothetical protein
VQTHVITNWEHYLSTYIQTTIPTSQFHALMYYNFIINLHNCILQWQDTLVILWSIFIPLKINNAMNNICQLVLISCAILSLSSSPLIPLTAIPKSEKFRFPKRVWSQGFRIRDCVPVLSDSHSTTTFGPS